MKKRTIILKGPEARALTSRGWAVRAGVSLVCALAADSLQWLFPPGWVVYDGAMVLALLLIWGWRWEIAVAVIPEVVPGLDLFPTWTLFAGYLIASHRKSPAAPRNVTPGRELQD